MTSNWHAKIQLTSFDMTKNENNPCSDHSGHHFQQSSSLTEQCHTQIFAWLNSATLMNFWYDKKLKQGGAELGQAQLKLGLDWTLSPAMLELGWALPHSDFLLGWTVPHSWNSDMTKKMKTTQKIKTNSNTILTSKMNTTYKIKVTQQGRRPQKWKWPQILRQMKMN